MRYLICLFVTSVAWADVTNASVELTGGQRYQLSFNVEPADVPVSVFASHSPDRIEGAKPVTVIRKSPADVELPGWTGRAYFHLKTARGKDRVVSVRRLPLEGQDNFRDLGGYRTVDGRYVRWGRLYRSGQLSSLTQQDYEYLLPLNIRLVCDLRAEEERSRQPTHWPGDAPEFLLTSIGMDGKGRNARAQELRQLLKNGATPEQTRTFGRQVYLDMAAGDAPQFARIFARLLSANGASMVHCSAGKDRTGLLSALFLLTLGVPRETVIEDYMLTNRYVLTDNKIASVAVAYQKVLRLEQVPPLEVIRPVMEVERSYIESAMDAIVKRNGSFDEYRRKELHLSDSDVEKLRAKYLEP